MKSNQWRIDLAAVAVERKMALIGHNEVYNIKWLPEIEARLPRNRNLPVETVE